MATKVTKVSLDETKIKALITEALAASTPVPTQVAHPWRATLRTALATTVGVVLVLGSIMPEVLDILRAELGAYIPADMMAWIIAGAGLIVAVSSALTRIMAIPAVNAALARFGLAATPAPVSRPTPAGSTQGTDDAPATDEDLPEDTSEESDEEAGDEADEGSDEP